MLMKTDSRGGMLVQLRKGWDDLVQGIALHEMWIFMGWRDVRKHYQRSMIGPFWLTLNMGILVGGLGFVYAELFNRDIQEFLPYLATGFIFWALIGGVMNEACMVFSSAAGAIRQIHLPLSVYPLQFMWRQVITFLHNFTIFILVAFIFGIWPGINGLMFFPGLLVLLLIGFFATLILGPLSARFRDIPPIIASVMQVVFFLTPIVWHPRSLPEGTLILTLNPFYHLMAIVREPLLGRAASAMNWGVSLGILVVLGVVATAFFCRFRSRIPYWA